MSWFPVDDEFYLHPKAVRAGNAALGLWARAGSWSMKHLTDGFVPEDVVMVLGGRKRDTERLVAAGLWEHTDGGFQFHDWSTVGQKKTREQVLTHRQGDAVRKARQRARAGADSQENMQVNGHSHGVTSIGQDAESHGTDGGTWSITSTSTKKRESARKRAAHSLPQDWAPTDTHHAYATEHGIDLNHEAFKFRAHAEANDRRQVQWNSAFTQWLAHAAEYGSRKPQPGPSRLEGFVLPECPREIRDDGPAYVKWARAQRDAWLAGRAS